MSSLVNHPLLKNLINNCFARNFTFSLTRKVNLGNFFNKHNWKLNVEIEECGYDTQLPDNIIWIFRCFRNDNETIIYEEKWIIPYDYDYIINNIDEKFSCFVQKIHQIHQCIHCGKYIYDEIAFEDKCYACGLQCIYNTHNSEYICSICRDPIGYGFYKKCKNNHLMHIFCFTKYTVELNKNLCPYRCGSIIE